MSSVCIDKHNDGALILMELPATIAEAEVRIGLETRVIESCQLSRKVFDKRLESGLLSQSEYDAWLKRWEFTLRTAETKKEALETWIDATIDASESDVRAQALVNELEKAKDKIAQLEALLAGSDARSLAETKRTIAFREHSCKAIFALEETQALHGLSFAAERVLKMFREIVSPVALETWRESEECEKWLAFNKREQKRLARAAQEQYAEAAE